jgi:hypothetical protein
MRRWKEESEEGGLLRRGRLIDGGLQSSPFKHRRADRAWAWGDVGTATWQTTRGPHV